MNINRCMMEVDVRENWGRDRGRSGIEMNVNR